MSEQKFGEGGHAGDTQSTLPPDFQIPRLTIDRKEKGAVKGETSFSFRLGDNDYLGKVKFDRQHDDCDVQIEIFIAGNQEESIGSFKGLLSKRDGDLRQVPGKGKCWNLYTRRVDVEAQGDQLKSFCTKAFEELAGRIGKEYPGLVGDAFSLSTSNQSEAAALLAGDSGFVSTNNSRSDKLVSGLGGSATFYKILS